MKRTVIFDFDGTIAVGDGPVQAYARSVAEVADLPDLEGAAASALAQMHAEPGTYRDGYDAVATAARALGVTEAALSEGYRRSRALLGTDAAPVSAAPGLADFLERLRGAASLVLVTNAPETGLRAALAQLGVVEAFARLVCSAGKPDGLAAVVREGLADGPVLSVGDIEAYDLAPARALGAATALVGPTAGLHAHRVTFSAPRLELLYTDIQTWAAAPAPTSGAQTPA